MTPRQRKTLLDMVTKNHHLYSDIAKEGSYDAIVNNENAIVEFVDGLLEEKDAEIDRLRTENDSLKARVTELEARQVSPELEQLCDDFIGQRDADSYPMSTRHERAFAQSIGYKLVKFVESWQKEDEVQP